MDPIPEIDGDAIEPPVVRPAVAPTPVDAVPDAPDVVADIEPGSGALAETESLLGAVMTGNPDGEADALRRTLELDDRPATATPTPTEQADQDAALRRAAPATGAVAGASDPTEQFEAHDSALSGDPLAQAIDANEVARRAAQEQAVRADQRDDAAVRQEQVPGATDRATQDSGAAAATQFGAGRPPARVDDPAAGESEEARIERVERLAEAQRVRPARSHEGDAG